MKPVLTHGSNKKQRKKRDASPAAAATRAAAAAAATTTTTVKTAKGLRRAPSGNRKRAPPSPDGSPALKRKKKTDRSTKKKKMAEMQNLEKSNRGTTASGTTTTTATVDMAVGKDAAAVRRQSSIIRRPKRQGSFLRRLSTKQHDLDRQRSLALGGSSAYSSSGAHELPKVKTRYRKAAYFGDAEMPHYPYMLYPDGLFRRRWDLVISILVLYICYKLPFDVAYPVAIFDETAFKVADLVLDVVFLVDIVLNFRTGYVKRGHLVMDPLLVKRKYRKSWFWIDVLASFPFELVLSDLFESNQRKAVKVSKILKLSKLLRAARIVRYLKNYFKFRHLLYLLIGLVAMVHWLSCLWFLVETHHDSERFDSIEAGEVTVFYMYWTVADDTLKHLFAVDSIFTEIAHQTYSMGEHLFSIMLTGVGAVYLAFLIGAVTHIYNNNVSARDKFRRKMSIIYEEMEQLCLPDQLRHRVQAYYDYLWLNRKGADASFSIYNDAELSSSLKKDVSLFLIQEVFPLRKVKVLEHLSDDCLVELNQRMNLHIYLPGDFVCYEGDVGRELWYIRKGTVEVLISKQSKRATSRQLSEKEAAAAVAEAIAAASKGAEAKPLDGAVDDNNPRFGAGSFLGEVAILAECRRTASIRAVTVTEMSVLTKADLVDVCQDYPELAESMRLMALERLEAEEKVLENMEDSVGSNSDSSGSDDAHNRLEQHYSQSDGAKGAGKEGRGERHAQAPLTEKRDTGGKKGDGASPSFDNIPGAVATVSDHARAMKNRVTANVQPPPLGSASQNEQSNGVSLPIIGGGDIYPPLVPRIQQGVSMGRKRGKKGKGSTARSRKNAQLRSTYMSVRGLLPPSTAPGSGSGDTRRRSAQAVTSTVWHSRALSSSPRAAPTVSTTEAFAGHGELDRLCGLEAKVQTMVEQMRLLQLSVEKMLESDKGGDSRRASRHHAAAASRKKSVSQARRRSLSGARRAFRNRRSSSVRSLHGTGDDADRSEVELSHSRRRRRSSARRMSRLSTNTHRAMESLRTAPRLMHSRDSSVSSQAKIIRRGSVFGSLAALQAMHEQH